MKSFKVSRVGMLLVALALVLGACNGCATVKSWFGKADGTATTPIEAAKIVQKASSDSWKAVQETFAKARVGAEKAEKAGQPLAAGQITLDQWSKFSDIDRKVIASGRELAGLTKAIEAGTSKDTNRMQTLTAELFALFGRTKELAGAFGLQIPGLPVSAPSSSLPFALAALPFGLMLARRREIAGGAGGIDPAMIATISAGMIGAAGPLVADWATNNPGDQAKAEAAAKLLAAFIAGLAKVLPGIMEGVRDPSTINLDSLWDESAEQVLARVRAEEG